MPRRILEGEVVSNKTDKTITVLVERRFMHPVYKKYVKRTDKYAAHDEQNKVNVGDKVQIVECRPISKSKRWTLLEAGATVPVAAPKVKKEAAPKAAAPKAAAAKKAPAKTKAKKEA